MSKNWKLFYLYCLSSLCIVAGVAVLSGLGYALIALGAAIAVLYFIILLSN